MVVCDGMGSSFDRLVWARRKRERKKREGGRILCSYLVFCVVIWFSRQGCRFISITCSEGSSSV